MGKKVKEQTSSMQESSIKEGASLDRIPWVAMTNTLYAPRSFKISATFTNDSTSSIMSSCGKVHKAMGTTDTLLVIKF